MFARIARVFGSPRRKIQTAALATLAAASSVGILSRDPFVAPFSRAESLRSEVKPPRLLPRAKASSPARASGATLASGTRATMGGLPNLENRRVDAWIKRFTTEQRGGFAIYLRRKSRYEDMISQKLAARGMPQGLIYLAMIESGFNPRAKSPVQASGLWQFMSATGREYGLTINGRVDERNNPARSTDAALRYLDRLYDRFGSWYLAAAAYNTGQGRVAKVLRQVTGKTRGTDADYYRISHRLPQETRDYVPKLIAAARIGANPQQYGFSGD